MLTWSEADEGYQIRAHEHALEVYRQNSLSSLEMFRSVITYGTEALKAGMLTNGAAAGALLAFLGSEAGRGMHGGTRFAMGAALTCLAYRGLISAAGFGCAYMTP